MVATGHANARHETGTGERARGREHFLVNCFGLPPEVNKDREYEIEDSNSADEC